MEFGLLGRLVVTADGVDLTPTRPKQRALLAYLLLWAGEIVSTDQLVDALWGDTPPETAPTALHGHISMLRKRLGSERIETHRSGYLLRLAGPDELDIRRFERLVAEARPLEPAARSEALLNALALFRGEPLADFRFDAFATREAARLEEQRVAALEQQIDAELELGRHLAAIPELEQVIAEHPLHEGLRSQLMLALYRAGRQSEALHVAEVARRLLDAELGVEPGPALQRLEHQILNQDPLLEAPEHLAPTRPEPMPAKPIGIVTFLVAHAEAAGQRELVRTIATRHGGFEMDANADSALRVAFARARDAAASAAGVQRAAARLGSGLPIGIDSGEAIATDDGYIGPVARTAEHISRAAHGGQIVVSQATRDLLREAPLDEADVLELGEHPLTDLERARPLFQLVAPGLSSVFPPLRSLETRRTNLPMQPTPLTGREREIEEIAALLADPAVRLLTLTGPGGTGKTRLAVHVGAEVLDSFVDGVFFVALAPLADPELVIPTIGRVLGIQDVAGQSAAETLGRHLGDLRLLLVLDNFEHLRAAAPSMGTVLDRAPGLKVLVTSRTSLHLGAESAYRVSPLQAPKAGDGLARIILSDAVALFATRARAMRPEFSVTSENAEAVAGICRTLEGLPLAIELAAARIGVLPPASLLSRLDHRLELLTAARRDVPDRHRTLETAIGWSYDLLEQDQQALFARLAVFVGGCTLEAAETVCGDSLDVIDGLASLVDNSLVRLEGTDAAPRFAMLETIREYAARRLDEAGDADELRLRHAEHYLALAEEAEPHLRGSPGAWPGRLEREHDNLRAALDWFEASGSSGRSLALAGALWRFWYLRGFLSEGGLRLETALQGDTRPTPSRGKALIGAAVMAVNGGDVETARQRATEGLSLHRTLGDAWGAAYCQFMLGAASPDSELDEAQRLYEEAVRSFRELADEHSALLVTRNLAGTYEALGHRDQGRALYADNLRRARATDNHRMEASTLGALAMIAFEEGRVQDATWMLNDSLRIHRQLGDRLDAAVDLCRTARAIALAGGAGTAVRIISSFAAMPQDIGSRRSSLVEMNEETLASARRELDEAAFAEAWRRGHELTFDEAIELALVALA